MILTFCFDYYDNTEKWWNQFPEWKLDVRVCALGVHQGAVQRHVQSAFTNSVGI